MYAFSPSSIQDEKGGDDFLKCRAGGERRRRISQEVKDRI